VLSPIRGRRASPASTAWNLAKTIVQIVLFWGTFLFVLPRIVFAVETRVGGIALFALCGTLGLTSGFLMASRGRGTPLPLDAPRVLVVAGPYRFVRNPMAIGGIGQGVAVGLVLGSPSVILYALAGAFVWHGVARPWEERDLESWFGEPYRRYREAVRCWWPRWRPYDPPA
jgi:protein-S-isoprenylcysteine O-methyltransferase Ste14